MLDGGSDYEDADYEDVDYEDFDYEDDEDEDEDYGDEYLRKKLSATSRSQKCNVSREVIAF